MGFHWEKGSLMDLVDHVHIRSLEAGHQMAEDGIAHFKDRVARNTPVETHKLRDSYQIGPIVYRQGHESIRWSAYVWTGEVWTEVEYAPFVERGTGLWGPKRRKYKIQPKTPGGVLRFTPYARGRSGSVILTVEGSPTKSGQPVYARYVMHPGSPGAHMFQLGAVITEHEIESWSAKAMATWKREVETFV